jgi:ATP-dependent exoDNAse (exonuclease V) beta subunit
LISRNAGLVLCDTIGSGYDEVPNHALTNLRKEINDQDLAESARLLYVAITRARDHLVLSAAGGGKNIKGTWGCLLEDFLKDLGLTLDDSSKTGSQPQAFARDDLSIVLASPNTVPSAESPRDGDVMPLAERDRFAEIARARADFVPPPPDSLVLSPTELEVLARCPREYYWRYLAELPPNHRFTKNRWIAGTDDDSDGSIRMGLAAHAILERLDFGSDGTVAPAELEKIAAAVASEQQLTPAAQAKLIRDVSQYLTELHLPRDALIEREVPFFLRAGDEPELFVRGRIDLLCVAPGSVTIRDYKYAHASDAASYQLQMEIYALAAAEAYCGRNVTAELIFIRDRPVVMPIALRPFTAIRDQLQALARELIDAQGSRLWPQRPGNVTACRQLGCGYVGKCWPD